MATSQLMLDRECHDCSRGRRCCRLPKLRKRDLSWPYGSSCCCSVSWHVCSDPFDVWAFRTHPWYTGRRSHLGSCSCGYRPEADLSHLTVRRDLLLNQREID